LSVIATSPAIEIIDTFAPLGRIKSALFDFDGTLSLIREGWQEVMAPYFVEELLATPRHESEQELGTLVREFMMRLTGKQTIYQCFQLAEEVEKRGGNPKEPLDYKREYLRRLWERISHRVEGLKSGRIEPDSLLLLGSRAFLQALKDRGVTLFLASGTDLPFVLDEAGALQVSSFFEGRIYGALDEYRKFSKQMIIDRILQEHDLHGPELLAIGDGYVEIENAKGVGGIALGVASDEDCPGGLDEWKRERLIRAGADAIVRDFSATEEIVAYLGLGA
jgi:phosphoglycolate phosphatase-like HAD superfamily hydrolase